MISPKLVEAYMDMGYVANPIDQIPMRFLLERIVRTIRIQRTVGGLIVNKRRGTSTIIVSPDTVYVGIAPVKSHIETVMFYAVNDIQMLTKDGREFFQRTFQNMKTAEDYFNYLLWQFIALD